jgi:hypothetical protein
MGVNSLVTRLARLRTWQAPIRVQRGQDATVSTQTWVPDGLVKIYSYFPLLRKLFIQELWGEEYFYLHSPEVLVYESSVDVLKTHVPALICALKWTVNSLITPSRPTHLRCLSAMNAKAAFIYIAWTEMSYQLRLSLPSREQRTKTTFQKLNISCYVNGNKTLKSWRSRIRCSHYNILKCSCENPGLHLVIKLSVKLFHISHFSLFSFFF